MSLRLLQGSFETPDYSWETQGIAVNQSDDSGLTVLFSVGNGDVAPSSGVYKSTDGGITWVRTLSGVAANSNCYTRHGSPSLTIDASRPSRVWAALQQGLWRSDDGGESWSPVSAFNSASFYNGSAFGEHGVSVVVHVLWRAAWLTLDFPLAPAGIYNVIRFARPTGR